MGNIYPIRGGLEAIRNLLKQLEEAINAIPGANAHVHTIEEPVNADERFDAKLQATVAGTPLQLLIETKSQVFPRDAHEQVRRWQEYLNSTPDGGKADGAVVAAQTISPGARNIFIENGIGYFAEGGSLCLPFRPAFIYIDKPAERKPTKDFELFTEARTPVLQAMFKNPRLPYTVQDLASITGSSGATVSKLMSHLEREEWVVSEGNGPYKRRKLASPGAVLDAWVTAETARLPHRKERRFFIRGHKAMDLPRFITETLTIGPLPAATPYHFTAEVAAHHYAPFLTSWNISTMRADPAVTSKLVYELGAAEVQQGYNLLVIEEGLSALRFSDSFDNVPVASPIQTYVDLMCASGRAPDAAKFLREQILKF